MLKLVERIPIHTDEVSGVMDHADNVVVLDRCRFRRETQQQQNIRNRTGYTLQCKTIYVWDDR